MAMHDKVRHTMDKNVSANHHTRLRDWDAELLCPHHTESTLLPVVPCARCRRLVSISCPAKEAGASGSGSSDRIPGRSKRVSRLFLGIDCEAGSALVH